MKKQSLSEVEIPRAQCAIKGCVDLCAIGKKMCMYHLNQTLVRKNLYVLGRDDG